jgi:hypothetical protein
MFGADALAPSDLLTESAIKGSMWLIIAALVLCTPVRAKLSHAGELIAKKNAPCFVLVSAVKVIFLLGVFALSCVSLVGDTYNPFLYFRF